MIAIVGIVIALVVVIGGSVFAYYYWKYLQDDKAYGVAVPPGPLGVQFHKGSCTVHAVGPKSPLRDVTKEGETLVSVNGTMSRRRPCSTSSRQRTMEPASASSSSGGV